MRSTGTDAGRSIRRISRRAASETSASVGSWWTGAPSAIGTVVSAAIKRTRRPGFGVFEVAVGDRSGTARAVWFNQRFLKDVLHAGQTLALFGKVEQGASGLQFASPQYEILADEPVARARGVALGEHEVDDAEHPGEPIR